MTAIPAFSLLTLDEAPGGVATKLEALGFVPVIYSPWEELLTPTIIAEAKALNLRVIPWTVNEDKPHAGATPAGR